MSAPYFISDYDILVAPLVPTGMIIVSVGLCLLCCYFGKCKGVISISGDADKSIPCSSENSASSDGSISTSSMVSRADEL